MNRLFPVIQPLDFTAYKADGNQLWPPPSANALITGDDRQPMLDWYCDNGAMSMGYSPPLLTDAIRAFLDSGYPHRVPQMYQSAVREKCAEMLCDFVGFDKLYFANSGGEANETAIKMARLYQYRKGHERKHGILTLQGHYFGRTGFALAATRGDRPYYKDGFGPMPPGFGVLEPGPTAGEFTECWDDDEPPDVAAVIMSPILGNNQLKVYPPVLYQALREWCDDRGALLIFDEVQSGMGRCGLPAAYLDAAIGVKPDILTLGKGLAMGLPFAATLADKDVADESFQPGTHFYTFAGTDLNAHVCSTFVDYLKGPSILDGISATGQLIKQQLQSVPGIKSVWGVGLMIAFMPEYDGWDAFALFEETRKRGLMLLNFRPLNEVRISPPLNTSMSEVLRGVEIIADSITALAPR